MTTSIARIVGRGERECSRVAAGQAESTLLRRRLRWASVACDLVVLAVAYELALLVFSWERQGKLVLLPEAFDWSFVVAAAVILAVFTRFGLYRLEAYVSRPLHLVLLAKGTVVALVCSAFVAFALRTPLVSDSRMKIFVTFLLFFAFVAVVRLRALDRLYARDARVRRGATVVVGWFTDAGILVSRLRELRGFAEVSILVPEDKSRNGNDADPKLVRALQIVKPAPRQVILDGASLGHKATLDLVQVARARGSEVYITGRLLSGLDTGGLVGQLFEMPAIRVTRDPGRGRSPGGRMVTRVFNVVASAFALALLSPLFAVLAVVVKIDSRGPVFFGQERVGLHGKRFRFLKFRSMTDGNDAAAHRAASQAFINGEVPADRQQQDEWGRPVYKNTTDARVTRVGRFMRRYSLDELPQFWNVLRGDMSIVGPRPALPYEVEAYKLWHERRLDVMPGVTGLWQVAGRSRVGFDDMVFQDVMYGMNQGLVTDVDLCVRTVPAVVTGTGAA